MSIEEVKNTKTSTILVKKDVVKEKTVEICKRRMSKEKSKRFKAIRAVERKRNSAERAAKSHKELTDKVSEMYINLPKVFTLHESFVKVTKIQKLDQISKFIMSVKQHGYKTN